MKIEETSIFGDYDQAENRVTAAFLHICKAGGEDLIRYLTNELQIQLPSSQIEIRSQVKETKTIPDGLLKSDFSFKLYVESKIKENSIDIKQLEGHNGEIKNSNDFLLYLTPDDTKPEILESTHWANWIQIINIFEDYYEANKKDNKELFKFLVDHFRILLTNNKLLGQTWELNNDNVIIVAGSVAEGVALDYNYYICQNKRTFRSAKYLAFYNNNQIEHIFEIEKAPEDDVNLSVRPEFSLYLNEKEPSYNGDLRRVFTLINHQKLTPIINDSVDKNGKSCPFTYGQPRYSKLEKINTAKKTSQL
jgi:hypothetical protein